MSCSQTSILPQGGRSISHHLVAADDIPSPQADILGVWGGWTCLGYTLQKPINSLCNITTCQNFPRWRREEAFPGFPRRNGWTSAFRYCLVPPRRIQHLWIQYNNPGATVFSQTTLIRGVLAVKPHSSTTLCMSLRQGRVIRDNTNLERDAEDSFGPGLVTNPSSHYILPWYSNLLLGYLFSTQWSAMNTLDNICPHLVVPGGWNKRYSNPPRRWIFHGTTPAKTAVGKPSFRYRVIPVTNMEYD